jgi:hypothetical protein
MTPSHQTPRKVLLFSGHIVDAPTRASPRFPETAVAAAGRAIEAELARLDAGPADLAYTQGACGGDLLFTAACQARGVAVRWLQPFDEAEFIERSVSVCTPHWRARYLDARAGLDAPPEAATAALGALAAEEDPYERCNLWLLRRALVRGAGRLAFVCLWDGGGGDGPGGTAHMVDEVRRRGGEVAWIDTRRLLERDASANPGASPP